MEYIHSRKIDIILFVLLFFLASTGSYIGYGKINPHGSQAGNVWFQADIGRVYYNMTEQRSNHYRTKVHPLFSLATHPIVFALHKTGLQKTEAVRVFVATISGIWLATIFLILKLLRLRSLDAVLFSILAAASSTAFFWTTVPETFLLGSISILLVLAFVAFSCERKVSSVWYVFFSAISLSMTVTNWMAGILATKVNYSWKQSIRITLDAFLLVTVLWAIQNYIYPTSEFFLLPRGETHYIMMDEAGGFFEKIRVFIYHSMVMPSVQILDNPWAPKWPRFTIQFSSIGSTGILGWAMTALWTGLIAFGAWSLFQSSDKIKPKIILSLIILGQFCLHLLYGDETFLYSLHWLPLLVLISAMGATSVYRYYVLVAVSMLIVGVGVNNFQQFTIVATALK